MCIMVRKAQILSLKLSVFGLILTSSFVVPAHARERNPASSSTITAAPEIVENKQQFCEAINHHLSQLSGEFELQVKNYSSSKLPNNLDELDKGFAKRIRFSTLATIDGITTIKVTVYYNDAGRVVRDILKGEKLDENDVRALKIKEKITSFLQESEDKGDYENIIRAHDFVIQNATPLAVNSAGVYGTLTKGEDTSKGYAETLQMLYTLMGIENRVVSSTSKADKTADHYFNKVKLQDEWYNVDATVDFSRLISSDDVIRAYVLVTDKVSAQRYEWDANKYPKAVKDNNWHHRNGLVARNQAELDAFVSQNLKNGKHFFSVWIPNFRSDVYSLKAIKKQCGNHTVSVTHIPAKDESIAFETALIFRVK